MKYLKYIFGNYLILILFLASGIPGAIILYKKDEIDSAEIILGTIGIIYFIVFFFGYLSFKKLNNDN